MADSTIVLKWTKHGGKLSGEQITYTAKGLTFNYTIAVEGNTGTKFVLYMNGKYRAETYRLFRAKTLAQEIERLSSAVGN